MGIVLWCLIQFRQCSMVGAGPWPTISGLVRKTFFNVDYSRLTTRFPQLIMLAITHESFVGHIVLLKSQEKRLFGASSKTSLTLNTGVLKRSKIGWLWGGCSSFSCQYLGYSGCVWLGRWRAAPGRDSDTLEQVGELVEHSLSFMRPKPASHD